MCLFVCVVGTGFHSTSPAFVRSRASHAVGSDGHLVGAPYLGTGLSRHNLYGCVKFQPRVDCVFLEHCDLCILDIRLL